MIYVRMMDLQQLLQNMHSKMTGPQQPALDRFKAEVNRLERYSMEPVGPLSGRPAKQCRHPAIFEGRCVVCNKDFSAEISK